MTELWRSKGSPDLEQQRHDEMLRMRCLEIVGLPAFENTEESFWRMMAEAGRLYHEVTGRDWPVWDVTITAVHEGA